VIIECPGKCGKKVIANSDGKAYLCKTCYAALMNTLLHIIRPAKEPHLSVVKPTIEEETELAS
jgi:hypothetical protein